MAIFSREQWQSLTEGEKIQHVLKKCKCCQEKYTELTQAFPATPFCNKSARKQSKTPATPTTTLCEKTFVTEITKQLNASCDLMYGKTFESLMETYTAKEKVSSNDTEYLIVKRTKDEIEEMNSHACNMVMATCTCWNSYNTMRLTLGLEKRDAAPCGSKAVEQTSTAKRIHDYSQHIESVINTQSLLDEAKTWQPEQKIN